MSAIWAHLEEDRPEDHIKNIFTTLLKAKKAEDERAQKIQDAWQAAFAEVYFGQDDE